MKNINLLALSAMLVCCLSSCTSIQVSALDPSLNLQHICIENNPKVIVGDFLGVLEDGFTRHGISVRPFYSDKPEGCEYVLRYTALQSWDIATYLSHAELRIYKDDMQVASAIYHHEGKGGFDLSKWKGTKAKMDPVIDELLSKKQP